MSLTRSLQVHADASTFVEGVTKEEAYQQVLDQAEGLFFEQRNWVCLVNPQSLKFASLALYKTVGCSGP